MNSGNPNSKEFKSKKQVFDRGLAIQTKMTPDLAEICGIHAGDGYLRNDGQRKDLEISGGFEEKGYYDNHVAPLFEKYFQIPVKPRYFLTKKTYGFVTHKTRIIEFMHSMGFPYGKKTLTVSVPEQILHSKDLDVIYGFLRGVFDTDGCLSFRKRGGSGYAKVYLKRHTYPSISMNVCSKNLWRGVCTLLAKTGFQFAVSYGRAKDNNNQHYSVALRGDANLISWITNVGFRNPLKYNRFLIWKKFGFVPSELAYVDQNKILTGSTDPNSYYDDMLSENDGLIPMLVKRRLKISQNFESFIPKD
ncbi:MAG: hypothetical protein JW772_01880 [Candidatus Diapherotrites archaeon]|nr:hypothetical protein [Candidatus Diapherotrites archaeon]